MPVMKRTTWKCVLGAFLLIGCNATDPADSSHDDPGSGTGGSTSVTPTTPSGHDAGASGSASDAGAASGCMINGKQYAEGQSEVP